MGLDQYAYTKVDKEQTPLQDWRKHNALEGFMAQLYREKDGKDVFNCKEIEINASNLSQLTKAVALDDLPETVGFFFGSDTRFCEYNKEKTIEFIRLAHEAINNGQKVYYMSSW